jgi:leucyl-tRNA synthetase
MGWHITGMPAIKRATTEGRKVSNHQPRFNKYADGSVYALIVRIDRDGQENVIHGYARHFKSLAAAQKSAAKYMAKHGL